MDDGFGEVGVGKRFGGGESYIYCLCFHVPAPSCFGVVVGLSFVNFSDWRRSDNCAALYMSLFLVGDRSSSVRSGSAVS